MLTVFRLLSLRYLVQRWDRSALIVLSIALGVATLVSTRILNSCIERAAANTANPLKLGDLCVTNDGLGVQGDIAGELRTANIPGIDSVQPVAVDEVRLPALADKPAVLLGVEIAKHQLQKTGDDPFQVLNRQNPYKATFSKLIPGLLAGVRAYSGDAVVLSRSVYDKWKASDPADPDAFPLRYGDRTVVFTPIAVVDFDKDSPLAALGFDLVGMEIDRAAKFLRPETPRITRIDLMLTPGADPAAAQAAVAAVVGDRASVRTSEQQGSGAKNVVGGIQIGFTMCSLGAMVVGLFLVYNALSVTVAERRHDIGILRSVGITRPQVVAVFLLAAAVLGLLGAAVGVPMGVGMAQFALNLIRDELSSMFSTAADTVGWPTWETVLLAVAAGLTTAVFAALVPAVQSAAHDPADAVRRTPGTSGGAWWVAHRLVCVLLVGGGVGMILARAVLPPRVGAFGGMVAALVGLLLAAPILVGLLVRTLQPLFRSVLPIEARLAADNLVRAPGRTGLVIGALGAGVAVMIQTAGVGKSNQEPVTRWLDEVIQADQFVAAGDVTAAISGMRPMEAKRVGEVARIPGVDAAAGIKYSRPAFGSTVLFLTAIDMKEFISASRARSAALPQLTEFGKLFDPAGRPVPNGVVVSDNFVAKHGIGVGGTLTLKGATRKVELTVVGVVSDFSWSQGTVFLDRAEYARLFDDKQIDIVHVFLTRDSEAANAAARRRVEEFAAAAKLQTEDRTALRRMVGELIERIYKLVQLQQVVVGIVASLGVITSLLISVLQRKRELGLLLAVGATPRQVVFTVLYEAILMGLLGTLLGFAIGIPLEWYVLRIVLREESGFDFALLLPWQQALYIAAGSLLIATVAGLMPAIRAVKTRIPDALAHQ